MELIPVLTTARLTLRPFQLTDASEVQRQAGSPLVAATTLNVPHPYLDGMAESWISTHAESAKAGHIFTWAITLTGKNGSHDGRLVGCISIAISKAHARAEIGYWIGEENWNKGYCSEAAIQVIQFAFKDLGLNKITARHLAMKPASGKVMLKCGMIQEGHLRDDLKKDGKFLDTIVYGLLKEDLREG